MNPSRPFILRPIATSLLMAAILLAGAVAYRQFLFPRFRRLIIRRFKSSLFILARVRR